MDWRYILLFLNIVMIFVSGLTGNPTIFLFMIAAVSMVLSIMIEN